MAPKKSTSKSEYWSAQVAKWCDSGESATGFCRRYRLAIASFYNWHSFLGDAAMADAILDRLVHNAHKIKLFGESLRKKNGALDASTALLTLTFPASVPKRSSYVEYAQKKENDLFTVVFVDLEGCEE